MAVPDGCRSVVMRIIDRSAERVTQRAGIDKRRWLKLVVRYMAIFEPVVDRAIVAEARANAYSGLIEQYIRSSKDSVVESLTDLEKIKAALKRRNRIVQIRQPSGTYVAKRLNDCSAIELDALAEQYERSAASDARRARFCRMLARQMRLAGLDDRAPLSRLIG